MAATNSLSYNSLNVQRIRKEGSILEASPSGHIMSIVVNISGSHCPNVLRILLSEIALKRKRNEGPWWIQLVHGTLIAISALYLQAILSWRDGDWRCWYRSIRHAFQNWPKLGLLCTASRVGTFAFPHERDPAWRLLSACPYGCISGSGRPDKLSAVAYWSRSRWMPGKCIRCFLKMRGEKTAHHETFFCCFNSFIENRTVQLILFCSLAWIHKQNG